MTFSYMLKLAAMDEHRSECGMVLRCWGRERVPFLRVTRCNLSIGGEGLGR